MEAPDKPILEEYCIERTQRMVLLYWKSEQVKNSYRAIRKACFKFIMFYKWLFFICKSRDEL